MFIPIYSMILLGLFLVFCLYALKILQKNNEDTQRQIEQLRKDIELILEKLKDK
ncbi:hypothetical protein [Enterococcus villorum]|uniref:hypothetical protein n=1 Tax=Enterococcus villorum TaxID=112904 RepID=UPI0015C4BB78|nr:hypothetical protein [Enterococcus villorum]